MGKNIDPLSSFVVSFSAQQSVHEMKMLNWNELNLSCLVHSEFLLSSIVYENALIKMAFLNVVKLISMLIFLTKNIFLQNTYRQNQKCNGYATASVWHKVNEN